MPNKGGSRDQQQRSGQSGKDDSMKRGQQRGSSHSDQQRAEDDNRQQGGQRGGSGNFANDPDRASEAGRKGGQS